MSKEDSFGEVLNYIDGYAYGVSPEGRTVCLGTETDIRAILANPRKHPQNPTIAQVINLERQLVKQGQKQVSREQAKVKAEKKEKHKLAVKLGLAKKREPRKNKNQAQLFSSV